jgi:diguanylate cyclase (GGDEF)-like protein
MLLSAAIFTEGVLSALDLVVLERNALQHFKPVAKPPDWFDACFNKRGGVGNLGDDSPFMANFLISAEKFWATANTGRTGSGLWTEVDDAGVEQHFEAFACGAGERKLLIINRLLPMEYPQRQSVFQNAREALLRAGHSDRARSPFSSHVWSGNADVLRAKGLSALPNRLQFEQQLADGLAMAQAAQPALCLLRISIDNFDGVATKLGPVLTAQLLTAFTERLLACASTLDTVGGFGHAEFALFVPLVEVPDDAMRIVSAVQDVLRPSFQIGSHVLHITASIGAALSGAEGEDATALLACAQVSLHSAREHGGNHCKYSMMGVDNEVQQELRLDEDLRLALWRDEFVVHYQPRLNLESGQVVGMEALLRWQAPGRGLVPPLEFLPFAERTGLIVLIGEWVLRRACQQLRSWHEQGLRDLALSVNLSVRQLEHPGLLDCMRRILEETKISPQCLELELTESAVMKDIEACIPVLHELKALGVGISIDDFGTGYSSLAYLKRLPVDVLKIDRAFVTDIALTTHDAAIVAAIVTVAHQLKLTTVAEGVTSQDQLGVLGQLGCDEVQGFLFSRAIPEQDFAHFVNHARATALPA